MINLSRKNFAVAFLLIVAVFLCAGCGNDYSHITHEEAQEIIESNPNAIVLDVRTQEEFDKKHIPNSLLVPIEDLHNGDFSKLPDKNATILIYCWTGRRSEDAAEILVEHGYKNIYEMGGIVDWKGAVEGEDLK